MTAHFIKMPSVCVGLAWAVPVDIVSLGAHLEAYIKLRPILQSLRLCNRFGKTDGHAAAVTRLPYELIDSIEATLIDQAREDAAPSWELEYKCYTNTCDILDHLTDDELTEMYCDVFDEAIEEGDLPLPPDKGPLTEEQRAMCCDAVQDGEIDFYETHLDNREEWKARVGRPTEDSRGFFTKHQEIILAGFGLELLIAHVAHKVKCCHRTDTVAYLTIPSWKKFSVDFRPQFDEFEDPEAIDDDMPMVRKTESMLATPVGVPERPSDGSMARFSRAVKQLGLQLAGARRQDNVSHSVKVSVKAEEKATDVAGAGEHGGSGKRSSPPPLELTMLLVHTDLTTDFYD